MSKKNRNKKIKKRCPNCNKKNTFAKENWKGAENTNCKYCGSKLNAEKTYEPQITKPSQPTQPITKIRETESLKEATSPSLKLGKTNSRMKRYILGSIAIIFIFAIGFLADYRDQNTLEEVLTTLNESDNSDLIPPTEQELCSKIQGVPAWIQNKEVISYGYNPNLNVSYLIDNKIFFIYSSTCPACHKQIEEFGDQWETYVSSGYTAKCW